VWFGVWRQRTAIWTRRHLNPPNKFYSHEIWRRIVANDSRFGRSGALISGTRRLEWGSRELREPGVGESGRLTMQFIKIRPCFEPGSSPSICSILIQLPAPATQLPANKKMLKPPHRALRQRTPGSFLCSLARAAFAGWVCFQSDSDRTPDSPKPVKTSHRV